MSKEKFVRVGVSKIVPFADTNWDSVGARLLLRARRSLAESLWGDTQTEEFPTVSKAVHALENEVDAAHRVATWQYFSKAKPLDAYPCKLIRDSAWATAERAELARGVQREAYLAAWVSALEPQAPTDEHRRLSDKYLSRTMRIRAIGNACAWYVAARFIVRRTNSLATGRAWDAHDCLGQIYRFLGQADAFEVALVQRAHEGQQARERTLDERRNIALDAIRRSMNDYAHLSGPKFADELVNPKIKMSHRAMVKLINEERRKHVTLPGNTDV